MNIDELKELAEGATPGPWARFYEGSGDHVIFQDKSEVRVATASGGWAIGSSDSFERAAADAAFISAANPRTVLALIEVARAAKSFDDALNGAVGDIETIKAGDVMSEALAKLESL